MTLLSTGSFKEKVVEPLTQLDRIENQLKELIELLTCEDCDCEDCDD